MCDWVADVSAYCLLSLLVGQPAHIDLSLLSPLTDAIHATITTTRRAQTYARTYARSKRHRTTTAIIAPRQVLAVMHGSHRFTLTRAVFSQVPQRSFFYKVKFDGHLVYSSNKRSSLRYSYFTWQSRLADGKTKQ